MGRTRSKYTKGLIVNYSRIVFFLIGLVMVFDILYKSSAAYYLPFGIFLLTAFCALGTRKRIRVLSNAKECKLFLFFIVYSLLTCVCSDGMEVYVIKNLFIFAVFFSTVIMTARFADTYEKRHKLYITILIVYGLVFVVMFVVNYQSINLLNQLMGFLSISSRYRYTYGLGHPNDAGLNALTLMVISLIYMSQYKRRIKNIGRGLLLFVNIIAVIVMLASSCRNAILSLVIFCTLSFFLNRFRQTEGVGILCVTMICIAAGCGLLMLMNYYNVKSISDLWRYSGRMVAFLGVRSLFHDGKYLFGYGLTNKTDFLSYAARENKVFVLDSSYLYYFVHSGIVGAVILVMLVFTVMRKLINMRVVDKKYKNHIIAMAFTFLFTGLFETTFLYSGMPISFVFSIVILQFMINEKTIEDSATHK